MWISTEWAEINITQFGDDETYKNLGKEFCLVTLSHRGDLDWVAAGIIAIRYGFLRVSSENNLLLHILNFEVFRAL